MRQADYRRYTAPQPQALNPTEFYPHASRTHSLTGDDPIAYSGAK